MSKKFPDRKTSIFSLSDIQEDMEKEELLRRLQQEEEEKRLEVNDYITYSKVDSPLLECLDGTSNRWFRLWRVRIICILHT